MKGFITLTGFIALLAVVTSAQAQADAGTNAESLAAKISERPTNLGRTGEMHFTLSNAKGRQRIRSAVLQHADLTDVTKLAIHFTAPAAIRDTGFLSHDADTGEDQSWLYLPATDRVRRVPTSDRGDYFMGTDLTYGDLQDNFKFQLEDWTFSDGSTTSRDNKTLWSLQGKATAEARRSLGYQSFAALIDPETLFPVELTYTDQDGKPLKHVEVLAQEQLDGAWIATRFKVHNLQTGHQTLIELRNVRTVNDMDLTRLEADALDLGAPDLG